MVLLNEGLPEKLIEMENSDEILLKRIEKDLKELLEDARDHKESF